MASEQAIVEFVSTLGRQGLLTERKGAPPLSKEGAKVALLRDWHILLQDVTDEQLVVATAGYLRDPSCCDWYPQAGKILAHVPGRALGDRSDEMWGLVLAEMKRVGGWGTPEWPQADVAAITAGVNALGGWQHLCSSLTTTNITAERAAFRSAARSASSGTVLQLTGLGKSPRIGADNE